MMRPAEVLAAIDRAGARDRCLILAFRGKDAMDAAPDKIAALAATTRALDAIGVPHALIGGVAVGVHSGVPRATLDTDLAVHSSADRHAVEAAMIRGGFIKVGAFTHSLSFRHASGEPVQLAFDPLFDPMILRAQPIELTGASVPIVRKDDLIAMKERAAADPARRKSKRLRDQADVELLRGDVPDPDEGW